MKPLTALVMAVGLLGVGAPAQAATVLDFNALASDGSGIRYINESTFEYAGFKFASDAGWPPTFGIYGRDDPRNADPGGATINHRWSGVALTISRLDGQAFDLVSLDIADLFNTGDQILNNLQFFYADGRPTDSASFTTDNQVGLQTMALDRSGLSSFVISTPSGYWTQFDNLTVADSISAVPEPGAWALMIVGFFSLGSALRMRRRLSPA